MHVTMTSSRAGSIMAEKKSKWPIGCDFSHFTSIFDLVVYFKFSNGGGLLSSALLFGFLVDISYTWSIWVPWQCQLSYM